MAGNEGSQEVELSNRHVAQYPNLDDSLPDLFSAAQSENLRPQYLVTDFVTDIHQLTRFTLNPLQIQSRTAFQKKFNSGFHILNPSLWLILMLTGIFSALASFAVDLTSSRVGWLHRYILSYFEFWGGFGIWLGFALLFGAFAASVGDFISVQAQGSGIPQMKTIISGTKIFSYLSLKAFIGKGLGLIAATGAGLSIGKEGPFVHLSAMIGHNLCKYFKCFKYIYKDSGLHLQVLGAAVAAGVAATFGAPVGGVLFSIEVTASYYLVSNLWKAFFCAGWCSVIFNILRVWNITDLVTETEYYNIGFTPQVFSFAVLGVVCGILGAGFIWVTKHILINKNKGNFRWFGKRYQYTLTVVLICSIICYPFKFLMMGDKGIINQMFKSDGKLPNFVDDTLFDQDGWMAMTFYILAKLSMTAISITTPIPCGVFTPIFTAGSVIGRLYGQVAHLVYSTDYQFLYAMVGAACLTSTVTHTLSVAIIVFQLTGQINYLSYMLIGVIFSYSVGYALSPSIFDTLLHQKGLPYLPALKPAKLYNKSAGHIMDRSFPYLLLGGNMRDVCKVTCGADIQLRRIPVIDHDRILVGDLSMGAIREELYKNYKWYSHNLSEEAQQVLNPFFEQLNEISNQVLEYDTPWVNPQYPQQAIFEEDWSVQEFWNMPFNFNSPDLDLDRTPMTSDLKAPLVKVHYQFLMLGLFQIYVTYRGMMVGVIIKEDLIKIKN